MPDDELYDYLLIREATIIVRTPRGIHDTGSHCELYDVRTGARLMRIVPELQRIELLRGREIPPEDAHAILRFPVPEGGSRVVNFFEAQQRKLDTVVADSILDQLAAVIHVLQDFLETAQHAGKEERLWLAHNALATVRKFTGRELSDLKELTEWFKTHSRK